MAEQAQKDWVSLIPRSPDWAFALWEVGAQSIYTAHRQLGDAEGHEACLLLRVYELTGPKKQLARFREYRAEPWIGERPVLMGAPGTFHEAVIGLGRPGGAFVALARSRRLRTADGFCRITAPEAEEAL